MGLTATAPRPLALVPALCLAVVVPDATALAAGTVPNTGPGSDPQAGFGHVEGAPNVMSDRLLAAPFDAGDADPAEAAAAGGLWSPGTPENDLGAALDAM